MIRSPAGFDGGDRIKRYLDYYQPSYGVMMLSAGQFSPAALFASGEQGVWYDPSDLTTLYQDAAGTTPVTAVEQPVGLVLDKSGRGNHASQSTAAARPVLSARVNLLTRTEGAFNGSPWTKVNTTITDNTSETADPFGGSAASKVIETSATGLHEFYNNTGISFAGTNIISIYAKPSSAAGARTWIAMDYFTGSGNVTWFNLTGAGSVGTNASGNTSTITAVGGGWYRCTITRTATLTAFAAKIAVSDGVVSYAGDTSKFMYFFGADARPANAGVGLPAYQRVGAATSGSSTAAGNADYDTVGFPPYLFFDGSDDSLATGTINPGAVDKVQVFAGVRKLSDAAQGVLAEWSATIASNNGTFLLAAPDGATATFGFDSKGTVQVDAVASSLTAPLTRVVTGLGDISGDTATIRINGVQADQDTGDQGTGNYLSYPLYIGSRAGSTLRFNGHLYSLVVRFSATNLPDATIAQTEAWVNGKTYAY